MPLFLMAPAAYFLATSQPTLALIVFFLLYAWHSIGAGLVIIGWQIWSPRSFLSRSAGAFLASPTSSATGRASWARWLCRSSWSAQKFPSGYVLAFGAAAVMVLLSWISYL
jgi:hypothetical protein